MIDKLKIFKGVDFNQGLDARLLTEHHIERLRELNLPILRFAWDDMALEAVVLAAIDQILALGFAKRRVHCYILYGFNDTADDALYRAETIRKRGIKPFVQRYQRLDTVVKNSWIAPDEQR